jgi:hypothetical protein
VNKIWYRVVAWYIYNTKRKSKLKTIFTYPFS